jgi:serine/threonine protein kinase
MDDHNKRVTIIGLDEQTLLELLKVNYPNKTIRNIKDDELLLTSKENEILLFSSLSLSDEENEIKKLKKVISEKDSQIKEMEVNTKLAVESIQTFHHQQQALYDEFLVLRQKYDEQKTAHIATLWTYCASFHPDLSSLPMEESKEFPENETQVGKYSVTDMLGEGQFAIVYSCHATAGPIPSSSSLSPSVGNDLAIKVINKERITSFSSLRRVSNEISILKSLNCPFVIKILDVIHTKTKLYIITEKGGQDLFEFFDEHPDGVNESWAQEITAGILTGVLYCHMHSVCHRDLKPENLLLRFDQTNGRLLDIKLCDFGLSTRYTAGESLTDFCGSPGFFAPEMITKGSYLGDKVDIWSVGCILLELVLGHERFCDLWMGSYDYEVMQNVRRFDDEIETTVKQLPQELRFTSALNQFIIRMLSLDPAARPSAGELCRLDWMKDKIGHLPTEFDLKLRSDPPVNHSNQIRSALRSPSNPSNMLKAAMSNRERQMMQDYVKQGHHKGEVNLPPIEPTTPSITKARKIMKQGEQLVKRANTIDSPQGQDEKLDDVLMVTNHNEDGSDNDQEGFLSPI